MNLGIFSVGVEFWDVECVPDVVRDVVKLWVVEFFVEVDDSKP